MRLLTALCLRCRARLASERIGQATSRAGVRRVPIMERIVLSRASSVSVSEEDIVEIFIVRSWKPLALRGLAGVLFGLVAFLWPSITLAGLVLLFGAYALVDGLFTITAVTRQQAREHAWTLALEGLIGLGIGLAAFLWTGMTAVVLVNIVAFWAIFTGILEIALAVRLRREIPGEFLLGLAGGASVLLGVLMFLWPAASAFVIVVMLGCYALFFGASMLALAFRLRRLTSRLETFHDVPRSHLRSHHGTA